MATAEQYPIPFDQGKIRKELGQLRAVSALNTSYKSKFEEVLKELAELGNPFSSEDITSIIGFPGEGQNKNNGIGALMSGAAKQGLIRKYGWTVSRNEKSHAREIRLWIGEKK